MAQSLNGIVISDPSRPETLPRARIIRRRGIFDLTRAKGRRINNRWMTLSVLPVDPLKPDLATVAFLTPKRLGPATVRNQLRRRMREIYRRHLHPQDSLEYGIWIARPPAVDLPFDELKACMTALQQRARPSA